MSRLLGGLTSSGSESQGESRGNQVLGRLAEAMSERKSQPQDEVQSEPRYAQEEAHSDVYGQEADMSETRAGIGNYSEARGYDEPQAVLGDTSYSSGYNISVETLTSGYILRVGCQSIAVESGADVGKLIGMYLSDKTIGKKWMSSDKIIKKFLQEDLQVK